MQKPPFPSLVDSSMLATYDSCSRKFFWQYMLHLAPHALSPDLVAGGAFAHALEIARRALWVDNLSLDEALRCATLDFIKQWGDYEPPENHPKSFINTLGALYDYFREYPPNDDPVKPYIMSNGKPAVEFTFAVPTSVLHPVTNEPILYCGRFDLLGYYNDTMFIIDEKTTKALGTYWLAQWEMRGQFMGYCWAAQQYGFPVNNALIRGIAIQKTQYKHLQSINTYPNWQLEQWHTQMERKIKRMVQMWELGEGLDDHYFAWDMSYGDACGSYGGCQYTCLCTSPNPSTWFSEFEERIWNPLHKD